MRREYDARTGRPLERSREAVETLTDSELDAELLIVAAATGRMRTARLERLWRELRKRRFRARFGVSAL
jgi:hypothetical protein